METLSRIKLSVFLDITVFLTGIYFFTYFSQQKDILFLVSMVGLIVPAFIVGIRVNCFKTLLDEFGLKYNKRTNAHLIPIALLSGIFFSILYRHFLHINLFPVRMTLFAAVAALTGSTEELIFRGFIQTRARETGKFLSILIATVTHTGYKYVLFFTLYSICPVNLGFLVFWTFAIGLILSVMKEISGSCWLPVFFHAIFDIIVYGDGLIDPWWIFV